MYNAPSSGLAISTPFLNLMSQAAIKASKGLIRDFGEVENLQVSRKGPGDFVSKTDKRSEKIIVDALQWARPEFGLLVEESGVIPGSDPDHRWIVDPLDGTTNFINAVPHFAISIALERRGEVIAGLVYDPLRDEMFYAEKGKGAYLNGRKLRVSNREKLMDALIGVTFPRAHAKGPVDFYNTLHAVEAHTAAQRRMGSAVLDLCYVAAGRFDACWSVALCPWDMAAGSLIITEAGGQVTNILSQNFDLTQGDILASNTVLHNTMQSMMNPTKA